MKNYVSFGAKGSQGKSTTAFTVIDRTAVSNIFEVESNDQYRLAQLLRANKSNLTTVQISAPSAEALRSDSSKARDVYAPVFEAFDAGHVLVDLGAGYERAFFEAAVAFEHGEISGGGVDYHFLLSTLAHERLSHAYIKKLIAQTKLVYPAAEITAVIYETAAENGIMIDSDRATFDGVQYFKVEPCISKLAPDLWFNGALNPSQIAEAEIDTRAIAQKLGMSPLIARAEFKLLREWMRATTAKFDQALHLPKSIAA
ncbi:MAG: hypothetical protein ING69_10505 [Rhodocyclaceae bacterium]|nr:hypothetical protein [Rhodocyclaceae bacterium]